MRSHKPSPFAPLLTDLARLKSSLNQRRGGRGEGVEGRLLVLVLPLITSAHPARAES